MIIKKEFKLTEAQYVSIFKDVIALGKSTPEKPKKPVGHLRQRMPIIIVMFIFFAWIAFSGKNVSVVSVVIIFSVYGLWVAFIFFYMPYCYKAMARKVYRTSGALQNDQYIEVSPDGILTGGDGHKSTLSWSKIYKIEKGNHNYLIFLSFGAALGIPLDLLNGEEQAALATYNTQLKPATP